MTGIYPIYDIKLFPHVVVFVMIDLLHSLMCGLDDAALLDWMLPLSCVIRIADSLVFVIVEIGVHFLAKLSILMLKEQTVERLFIRTRAFKAIISRQLGQLQLISRRVKAFRSCADS